MNSDEIREMVQKWGANNSQWRPFFTPANSAIVENWLLENDKPFRPESLSEAFRVLADSGRIISEDGTPPPGKPRPRTATAVLNPETPPPQSGPSAADQEFERFYHASSTRVIKERMKRDGAFKKWLKDQTRVATMHPTGTAQPADPLAPSKPKPVFVAWKFHDVGPDAPQQPRFSGGVKVFLPRLQRLVAGVDTNKRILALCDGEPGGLHFSLGDGRQLVRELARQNEPAELR